MVSQSGIEKFMFYNIGDVTNYLESKGFTISNNKILWDEAEADTSCYWQINNNVITFHRSDGQSAFTKDLVNFNYTETIDDGEGGTTTVSRPNCVIFFIPLADNGIALYMGMVTEDTTLSETYYSCANDDPVMNNGLVVLSPEEDDGHWYYGWNSPTDNNFHWCLDNGHGSYEYDTNVQQLPPVQIYQTAHSLTLVRCYLNTGYWSKNFRQQVTGDLESPGCIFKINGQKYITFTNNSIYRAPAYKLPAESVRMNLSTSTEEYSELKTYAVGDYCTYEGYLYRCITAITEPEPFEQAHWVITTVHDELMNEANHIYGN